MDLDVDKADQQIDSLITRRAIEREQANLEAAAWVELVKRYNFQQAEERRWEWISWHRRQAALFEALAQEHRERLGKLLDLAAGG